MLNNRLLPEWGAWSLQLPPWHLPWISSLLCAKKGKSVSSPQREFEIICLSAEVAAPKTGQCCAFMDDETRSQPITELLPVAPEPTSHLPAVADPWEPVAPEDPQTETDSRQ